jgi:hypothetical protein
MDDDFQDCFEEVPSGEDEFASSGGSKGCRYMGAGAGILFAAAGFNTFAGMIGIAWGDGDDDMGAGLTKAVDADDARTYMNLGSDAYNAPMNPISNGFGTAGTPVTPPLTLAVETAA